MSPSSDLGVSGSRSAGAASDDKRLLRELIDKEQIRDVLARYCRAVDRLDADLLASVYHPGAIEDHGAFKGSASDFCKNATGTAGSTVHERRRHFIGMPMIELDGDIAYVETYFSAGCELRELQNGYRLARVHDGRYVDRFEWRNGEWRIAARTVVKDYIEFRPLADVEHEYVSSRYGSDDFVYQIRGS
jgi:SnoaL-like domain